MERAATASPVRPRGRLMCIRAAASGALIAAGLFAFGCGSPVDIKQTFEVTDLSGGWFDAGIVDGKNKLVPSVSFKLQKRTGEPVRPLSLNVHFRKITPQGEEEFEEVFLQRVDFPGGSDSIPLTVRPQVGYTADPPQSRADMLKHSLFQDMRAVVFVKQSSSTWVELARFNLPRQLLTE